MATACEELLLAAVDVSVQAGEAKGPVRLAITAYSGGLMRVAGYGLLAVDLAGVNASERIPILADHNSALDGILGQGTAEVREGKLIVRGELLGSGDAAQRVLELARGGFAFQASLGAQPLERRAIAEGESVRVNAREIAAPRGGFTLITKCQLREVSILSLGADGDTSVQIAAKREHSPTMKSATTTTEANEARIAAIRKICDGYPQIEAQAIREGWDNMRCELEVLRESRPKLPPVFVSAPQASTPNVLAAALFRRLGLEQIGEKHLGAESMECGRRVRGGHLLELCRAALEAEGHYAPGGRMELIRAAFSTISLPVALGEVASKLLLEAYQESAPSWRAFAAVRPVANFKPVTGLRPSLIGQLELLPPGGEIKHGSMNEAAFPFKIDSYAKMLSLDRRDIINDDLGVFLDLARAFGQAARRKVSDLAYETLLTASGFFTAAQGNLMSGADSALGHDALARAITLLSSQRNEQGDDLDIRPRTLVVPPELAVTAQQILKSEQLQRNAGEPTANVLKGIVNLEIEPRLSNTKKFGSKASAKQWFLFGAPFTAPLIVAFLEGNENPTVEFFGLDSDPNRLAASWRVYFDFGAALGDPRAAVRSAGR